MKRLIAGYVASFARWICRSLRSLVMSQASLASCAARVASLVCRKLRLLVCRKLCFASLPQASLASLPQASLASFVMLLLLVLDGATASAQEVICHRGYWDTDGSAQNSIRSLVKADSIGAWGSEFDVWMTADGVLVVNHDETFEGITIETAKWKQLKNMRLKNGEPLPTLEQMLECGKALKTRLIVEMKPHTKREQELEAARKIVKMVKEMGLEERVEYITFSYQGMKNLKELAPDGTPVYYLNGELSPSQLVELGVAGIDYSIGVMRDHPQWIDEAHSLGMKVNVWTVNSDRDMEWCINYGVDFITTNAPEKLQLKLAP